jgi:hypothetical protein
MNPHRKKKTILNKLHPEVYLIYGIFDFKRKKLIYVSLEEEDVELKFDLEDYDDKDYDIITFKTMVD